MLWKDEYKIGVAFIDEQHRKLFDLTDGLIALWRNKLIVDKYDKLVELVTELQAYTVYHFDLEEKYMKSIKYPKRFEQRIEHERFKAKLNAINIRDLDLNHDESMEILLEMIGSWLKEHILEKDMQLGSVINK